MANNGTRKEQGIRPRHTRSCPSRDGGRCRCTPSWEAQAYSRRDGKAITRTFPTLSEARAWRADTISAVRTGARRAARSTTVRQAGEEFMAGIASGSIRTRDGHRYRPSAERAYKDALSLHVYPAVGSVRVSDVSREDVRRMIERWQGQGSSASAIRNRLMPLRVIFNRAREEGEITASPLDRVRLPGVARREVEAPTVVEALARLVVLPDDARLVYALAMFAGLRLGEIRALRWGNIDQVRGELRVREAIDGLTGTRQAPKTRAGVRNVVIIQPLARELDRARAGGSTDAAHYVVHGRSPNAPFTPTNIRRKTIDAWAAHDPPIAYLSPHAGRHVFASYLIASGASDVEIQALMGHADPATTRRIYAHLLTGGLEVARKRLDAFFIAGDERARLASLDD